MYFGCETLWHAAYLSGAWSVGASSLPHRPGRRASKSSRHRASGGASAAGGSSQV